jgi:hypothetical protein
MFAGKFLLAPPICLNISKLKGEEIYLEEPIGSISIAPIAPLKRRSML